MFDRANEFRTTCHLFLLRAIFIWRNIVPAYLFEAETNCEKMAVHRINHVQFLLTAI